MRLEAAVGGVLFTASVLCSAVFGHDVAHGIQRRHASLHMANKREAEPTKASQFRKRSDVFNAPGGVWPTVAIPAGFTLAGGVEVTAIPNADMMIAGTLGFSSAVAMASGVADPATWNTKADQACMEAVARMQGRSTNPSGMAACFNVPFLDANKGVFEAELRIFKVSMASAEFLGIPARNMMVTFQILAATLQTSDGTLPIKRSLIQRQAAPPTAVASGNLPAATGGLWRATEVSVRKYVGQLKPGTFTPNMNQTEFKNLLTPQITISAVNPATSRQVATLLSPTEASFVVGLFTTTTGSLNDPAYLLDKPAEKLAAAAQGLPTPYIVPGLSLQVFPTGLIITCLWLMAFTTAIGLGTLGRLKFREEYRREMRASLQGEYKTI